MEGLSKWLYDLSWPLVSRVLTALGVGTVTFSGLKAGLTAALVAAKAAFGGIGGDVLHIVAMCGFFEALAITSGGVVSAAVFMAMKRFALQSTGN